MKAKYIVVEAGVRYWEDAIVNGQADEFGNYIPFKCGDIWNPTIEIATGRIVNWPADTVADIHYKVCDAGEYWLADENFTKIAKYSDWYVPSCLSVNANGYGDYIIMNVDANGMIENWLPWSRSAIDYDAWEDTPTED